MFNFTTVVFDGTSPTFYFTNTSGLNTSSSNIFESLSKLSPVIILNQISKPMFSELLFIHHAGNISKTEEQYRQMPFVDWKEEVVFKEDGPPL